MLWGQFGAVVFSPSSLDPTIHCPELDLPQPVNISTQSKAQSHNLQEAAPCESAVHIIDLTG